MADSYLKFLKNLDNANATAEFFAHIRVLHATFKGGKDAYDVTLEAMEDVQKLLGYKDIPGVQEFDGRITANTSQLFLLMRSRGIEIDKVITTQTSTFSTTSSIIEHFNKSLSQYDMFGVNRNADVRYQNTRAEMLLAIDEIVDRWTAEKNDRDNWIQANRNRYLNKAEVWLQMQWAQKNKSSLSVSLPDSLETRISNFIQKLKGQIALKEALTGESELMFLESQVSSGMDSQRNCLYDFDAGFFREHGSNLVIKYY